MDEMIVPLPEKIEDIAGARIAALVKFKAEYTQIPEKRIRVELRAPGEIRVYGRE